MLLRRQSKDLGSVTYRASRQISNGDCVCGRGEEGEENGGRGELHGYWRSSFLSEIGMYRQRARFVQESKDWIMRLEESKYRK